MKQEVTISSKKIYDGKIIKLRVDTVELTDQKYSKREIIEHPGGVGVLVVDQEKILLVQQYRKAMDEMILEIPAGKLDFQEETSVCAARELREETGIIVESMTDLGEIYPSVGYTDEKIHLYFADQIQSQGAQELDEDESVEITWMDRGEFESRILRGEFRDAKTLCAYFIAKQKGLIG